MFLGYHLATKHGIEAEVVIGYVNDGTDDLYASHAWIESGGRITDVAISRPEEPRLQKSGPLMILDTTVKPGWNGYTYHREMPPVGVEAARKMGADPRTRSQLAELDSRHAMMTAMAKDPAQMLAYLDGAPDGMDYRHMAGLVDE